jgi:hypothetical protein
MMRADLEQARNEWLAADSLSDEERANREKSDFLKYQDSSGRFADFHANRHTFITNLSRAGVSAKTAQTLARHSDVRLTLGVYSHTNMAEKKEAISRLGGLWERFGSDSESQSGVNGQSASQEASSETQTGECDDSPEVSAISEVDATCHAESDDVESTPHWIRTSNLRFRRLRPNRRNLYTRYGVTRTSKRWGATMVPCTDTGAGPPESSQLRAGDKS